MVSPNSIYYYCSTVNLVTSNSNRRATSNNSYPVTKMWKKLN